MLSQEQVEAFERDGFVKGNKVLADSEVDALITEVMRVIEQREQEDIPQPVHTKLMGDAEKPIWQIVNIWQASEPFHKLLMNPGVANDALKLIGGSELRVWHDQIQYKPPTLGGVNMWHQDSEKWGVLQPKTSQVTAWIALDDADADNGAMSMVPGSHKWGLHDKYLSELPSYNELPETFEGHPVEARLCPVERGCVHFHHCLTWHGSHGNESGRHRRAIAIHFMNDNTVYNADGWHVMSPYISVADGEKIEGGPFTLVASA